LLQPFAKRDIAVFGGASGQENHRGVNSPAGHWPLDLALRFLRKEKAAKLADESPGAPNNISANRRT
jgi:hypothetical protein